MIGSDSMDDDVDVLDQQAVVDLINDPRRCEIIKRLAAHIENEDDVMPVIETCELAEYIACYESDSTPDELDDDEYREVYTNITEVHIPALERYNLVDCITEQQVEPKYIVTDIVGVIDAIEEMIY